MEHGNMNATCNIITETTPGRHKCLSMGYMVIMLKNIPILRSSWSAYKSAWLRSDVFLLKAHT